MTETSWSAWIDGDFARRLKALYIFTFLCLFPLYSFLCVSLHSILALPNVTSLRFACPSPFHIYTGSKTFSTVLDYCRRGGSKLSRHTVKLQNPKIAPTKDGGKIEKSPKIIECLSTFPWLCSDGVSLYASTLHPLVHRISTLLCVEMYMRMKCWDV